MKRLVLCCLLIALAVLPGCAGFTDTVQLLAEPSGYALYGDQTIGQEFVCHHAGLEAISVLLRAQEGTGDLVLHLRESVDSDSDLATVTLAPPPGDQATYYEFAVPRQNDANGRPYYVLLEAPEASAEAAAMVPYSQGVASQGALTIGGADPLPGQLSYQLHYDSQAIARDLGMRALAYGLEWLWLLSASAAFYLLPGGVAVVWLLRDGEWIERTIVALCLSVAIYALLVYATMTGLRMNRAVVIGFLAFCAVLIGARWWMDWRQRRLQLPSLGDVWASIKRDPSPVALAFVFALVLGVRVFVVRDLVAPMWGDAYHHTMIAQLLVDNGGLFDSWAPYAPLTTFTYHLGFHANVALFHWLSGGQVIHSTLWIGQMLNALAVLALYPLAVRVGEGNRWAGVGAVLVAGLLFPMPMYYVNWGRYTQLAALVILPVLLWLTWEVAEKTVWDWRLVSLAGVTLAALGLTHYRVLLIYAAFVAAWGVVLLIRKWGEWKQITQVVLRLAAVGALASLVFAPWAAHMFQARIPEIARFLVREGTRSSFHSQEYNTIGSVSDYVPPGLLVLGVVSVAWYLYRRRYAAWSVALWVGLLLFVANPGLFGLPFTGLVNNFAVLIMFYIPVGLLTGAMLGDIAILLSTRWRRGYGLVLVAVALVVASVWGAVHRVRDLDLYHVLVSEADLEAMAWIRENTPPDARFLVNGFMAYGGTTVVGSDAGWWIPLLTGRGNTAPPASYGWEGTIDPEYRERVRSDFYFLERWPPISAEGAQFLAREGVTHVYIGQKRGMVGNPGRPVLSVEALSNDPKYQLLYYRGGVWIFGLVGSAA